MKLAKAFPVESAIALIKLYKKLVSPLFPPSCRFYPSCSDYAVEAFRMNGFLKGAMLSAWRILRCNPLSKGGYDPVPQDESHGTEIIPKRFSCKAGRDIRDLSLKTSGNNELWRIQKKDKD